MSTGSAYENRRVVENYLTHKLRMTGSASLCASADDRERVNRALREAGDELERAFRPELMEMTKQLFAAPAGAEHRRFVAVADELFRDGANWGRVLAFLEFGALVCARCAPDGERNARAEKVARWMAEYLDGPLSTWILTNGGWEGFADLYTGQQDSVCRSSWSSLTTSVFSLAALGAVGLTLGAYLAQK
ncbi:apoptosis regulator Bcl-2 [Trichomycterus rosablanca]|uniref:apoptosis regulator Bcl-2 n=1 Tax=Trichomycterus rosablanca TaxID=2290929 RepID=UPI002F35D00C